MTKVVNVYRSRYDIDIRRPGFWGNPFIIGKDGSRLEVIAKFRHWVKTHPEAEPLRRKLKSLQGKTLGCCCKPFPCHGDVLVELADEE